MPWSEILKNWGEKWKPQGTTEIFKVLIQMVGLYCTRVIDLLPQSAMSTNILCRGFNFCCLGLQICKWSTATPTFEHSLIFMQIFGNIREMSFWQSIWVTRCLSQFAVGPSDIMLTPESKHIFEGYSSRLVKGWEQLSAWGKWRHQSNSKSYTVKTIIRFVIYKNEAITRQFENQISDLQEIGIRVLW